MVVKRTRPDSGTSILELLVAVTLLLIFAGATVSLYMANLQRYGAEQQTAEMNQAARNALELMSLEIQQAGSHPDVSTTLSVGVIGLPTGQTVSVASSANLYVGDWVTIDPGTASAETVKLTAVGNNTLSATVANNHAAGALVYLFAQPYRHGILVPTGLNPSSSTTTTIIKFFGNINSDGQLYYVEYAYNPGAQQITRSITPLSNNTKALATAIAENVANLTFTLFTDSLGSITKVGIQLTVNSITKGQTNQVTMSNNVTIRSTAAASSILTSAQQFNTPNRLPPTPPVVLSY